MLPPFIIDQIREREKRQKQERRQIPLELPQIPVMPPEPNRRHRSSPPSSGDKPQRGVVIIDLG